MKLQILQEILNKKLSKTEFAIVTNLKNGLSEIYEPGKSLSMNLKHIKNRSKIFLNQKKMV